MGQSKWISDLEIAVLLVDDEKDNRELVSTILDLCGYESIQAGSGAEALQLLTENPVDIILLDIMMPDMDGYEFCRQLKQSKNLTHIPIIMLTALVDEASRRKSFEVGANDFISKPFKMDDLIGKIEQLVQANVQGGT